MVVPRRNRDEVSLSIAELTLFSQRPELNAYRLMRFDNYETPPFSSVLFSRAPDRDLRIINRPDFLDSHSPWELNAMRLKFRALIRSY